MRRIFIIVLVLAAFFPSYRKAPGPAGIAPGPEALPKTTVGEVAWSEPPIGSETYRYAFNETAQELFDHRWTADNDHYEPGTIW